MENKGKSKKAKGKRAEFFLFPFIFGKLAGSYFYLLPFAFFLRNCWWWLRQVSGDAAYENYLRAARSRASWSDAGPRALSREEFYLDALRRRYTGVTRCC